MIPKSLILSFLALQPGMSPAPGAKDAVVFSGVPSTAQEVVAYGGSENAVSGWGVDTAGSTFIDFSGVPLGPLPPNKVIEGVMRVSAGFAKGEVSSRGRTYPNIPELPKSQDHVFGGQTWNPRVHVSFDKPRKNVHLWLLNQFKGGQEAGITITTTLYNNHKIVSTQSNSLKDEGWTDVVYEKAYDGFLVVVNNPTPGSNLLLAQVTYG